MKKIYAEWIVRNVFDNGFFDSWEEFFNFAFDPAINILLIKEI